MESSEGSVASTLFWSCLIILRSTDESGSARSPLCIRCCNISRAVGRFSGFWSTIQRANMAWSVSNTHSFGISPLRIWVRTSTRSMPVEKLLNNSIKITPKLKMSAFWYLPSTTSGAL
eukprot:CCRYP_009180-RB/>CCRYP_009180-RB protein AED:0.46 eAED:0.52 QI:0/1/0/1/0/0/2/0/117